MPTLQPPQAFDVAIAGGGPAGASCAIPLARAGLRVLLADGGSERAFRIGEGLPPPVRSLLGELGVLDRVLEDGHRPSYGTLAYWGGLAGHANDTLRQLHGNGLQLDRVRFDTALRAAASEAGCEVALATHLQCDDAEEAKASTNPSAGNGTDAAAPPSAPHRLQLRRAGAPLVQVTARWLIDASGRMATQACRLGARRRHYDRLLAFYQRLRSDSRTDQDGRTWVEAVEDGWWYSVLLPSGERVVAFLGDADQLDRRALLEHDGLWQHLQHTAHLGALCAEHGYRPHGAVQGADACSAELDRAAGERWLAVGDAALAFDPLSSKGIGNALYTGLRAAQALLAHEAGDLRAPERYADHLRDIHRVYRKQLQGFYAMETRWPDAPFWARRQAGPAVAQGAAPATSGGKAVATLPWQPAQRTATGRENHSNGIPPLPW
ncbi:FAD-dependent monooxygenase [Acidovorax sp. NCPPB 3576]|uniref:FAD-dependent monooxygenase n=1 Tax=Acidovorax sp. NCPPB 3576 TaxID=2940488 RepID=UPI0023491899|nr:FAD-dependent monooxygenase [Acidovorax sp. NCPPB 3576]WCM86295.1 tryptophan 7-halogenase [Acidovorax sp. NCPPB 3576]